jgi:hypothetical protein
MIQRAMMAAAFIDHFRQEGEEVKQFTRFKKGVSPNPGGKPKAEARPNSGEPEKPGRDIRRSYLARSSGEKLANLQNGQRATAIAGATTQAEAAQLLSISPQDTHSRVERLVLVKMF